MEKTTDLKGLKNVNADYLKKAIKDAKSSKVSLSYKLETDFPSTPEQFKSNKDTFTRLLKDSGIRTKSNIKMGVYSSKVDDFYKSSNPTSKFLFPEYLNRQLRQSLQKTDILDALVSTTTAIDSGVYQTIRLENSSDTKKSTQKKRIAEGAKFPTVKLTTSEQSINLHKYGLKLLTSYETVRRMSIDLLNIHMSKIGKQSALDQAEDAIDVLINGDGNSNAAPVDDLTALDGAAGAGTLTYVGLMHFIMLFDPYNINTIIGNITTVLKLVTLTMPNTVLNTTNQLKIPNLQDPKGETSKSIKIYIHNSVGDDLLLGFDNQFATEKVVEQGGELVETDKIIDGQFDEVVFSEMVAFGKLDPDSARVLDINA